MRINTLARAMVGVAFLLLVPGIALAGLPTAISYVIHSVGDHDYHLVTVNLARPEISIRTTMESERGRTTSSFSALVGAAVAVNGDWFIGTRPRGLARGFGQQWWGSSDLPDHAFIACTNDNMCAIESQTNSVTPLSPEWTSVVGGNDARLIVNGTVNTFTAHNVYTENTPRTAVGLSEDNEEVEEWKVGFAFFF